MLFGRNRHSGDRCSEELGPIMLAVDNLFAPRRHDVPHALISAALSLFALKLLAFSAPFLALGYPDIYVIVRRLTFVE
jgi:hypothetical protein